MTIFGRPIPPEMQPFVERQLSEMTSRSRSPIDHALAENFKMDSRVSEKRAERFFDRIKAQPDESLSHHLTVQKYEAAGAEFQDPEINGINKVDLEEPVKADTEVISVMVLHDTIRLKLAEILISANPLDSAIEFDLTDEWLERFEGTFHDQTGSNSDLQKRVSSAYMQAWEQLSQSGNSHSKPTHTWVTLADDFAKRGHLQSGILRWIHVLGLGHLLPSMAPTFGPHKWVLLLKYRVSDTEGLWRPCLLDAGATPWHFPSPAEEPAHQGGKSLVLAENHESLPEFIHPPRTSIRPSDIIGVFRLTKLMPDLTAIREKHRDRQNQK